MVHRVKCIKGQFINYVSEQRVERDLEIADICWQMGGGVYIDNHWQGGGITFAK